MKENIKNLIEDVEIFGSDTPGSKIHEYFEKEKDAAGIVLVEGEQAQGILMRTDFYQKIGHRFGFSLYMNRNAEFIMKREICAVESSCDLAQLGFLAMQRKPEDRYDFIVVNDNEHYRGVISISAYLNEMARIKEEENKAIRNLLDNAGQGFLFFGWDMLISEEYSAECIKIFGAEIGGKDVRELLAKFFSDKEKQDFEDVLNRVFGDKDLKRNELYLSLLPKEIIINNKNISVVYKVLDSYSEKIVMLVLTDITSQKELERQTEEEKANIKLVVSALTNKGEMIAGLEGLKDFLIITLPGLCCSESVSAEDLLRDVFRTVHTFKGDFGLYGFHHTANKLHSLEDSLQNLKTCNFTKRDIEQLFAECNYDSLLDKDLSVIEDILGKDYFSSNEEVSVTKERLTDLLAQAEKICEGEEKDSLLRAIKELSYLDLLSYLQNYSTYTCNLAESREKLINPFVFEGETLYLDRERYSAFLKSLVHIFKNIVAHGIETPEERYEAGKDEAGTVICKLSEKNGRVTLEITDDGAGLNYERIIEKALSKELVSHEQIEEMSEKELAMLIFRDDFSTEQNTDSVSGRGVGLSAVRANLLELGGEIEVESVSGEYTSFIISFPK